MGKHIRRQMASACGCIHIDGIWVTPGTDLCPDHVCTLCFYRMVDHLSHVHIGQQPPTLQEWATANPSIGLPVTPELLCYTRHRLAPGIHQDTPHYTADCSTAILDNPGG